MSNRRSNWMTSSLPRPTALNSPSLGRLSDIKGRLSFSAMKTPAFKPRQRSLVDHARSSASPVNGYHMSKQNPDVLDRLCSPSPSHRDTLLHKKTLSPAMVRVGAGSSMLMSARNGHQAPGQSSLVKQMLNDKHRAPTSLVHLATRGKTFRSGVNISPVVVKLSGAGTYDLPSNSPSLNSSREEGSSTENGAHETGLRSTNGEGSPVKTRDPCDKNVVMSALRQRRKRWATSGPDDDSDHTPSTSDSGGAPLAKRTKHSSQDSDAQHKHKSPLSYILGDRKRAYTAPSYSMSPDSKKSRFAPEGESGGLVAPLPIRSGGGGGKKVSLPDFEFDGESELSECSEAGERESSGGVSSKASSRAPSECIGGLEVDGLQQQRSLTPPVQFDEAEINRKREESLSNLKAVFSPKGGDKKFSNRRKLPIFCATGNKPHLPTPLSTTHTVTQEDLKKDREAAAAKLREILAAEDPPPPQTTVSMTSLTSLSSQSTLSLSTATAASTSKDTSNLISGVRLSSSLSGSLPSLPSASSVTKNSSSLSTAIGGGSSSLTMPKSTPPAQSTSASSVNLSSSALPKSSLAQTSTATAAPPSTQPLQVKSVSFAPLPVPTPASTTQANFAFPQVSHPAGQPPSTANTLSSSTAPQASTGLILGTNASISTAGTQLQLPQFSSTLATTTSTASAGNTLNTNATLQNSQASSAGGGGLTLTQGINFAPQQSVGFSLPGPVSSSNNAPQLSIFQGSATSSASSSVPSTTNATALALAPGAAGGSIFSGANSTTNAPSTGMPGGFTFALPTTTQQSQQQQSNSLFQSTKPTSNTANSSANTSSIFGMSSGLQMPAVSQSQQTSSTGPNGGLIFQAQPQQQQQQPSIFGGAQSQDSQKSSSGGISFNFSQTPANNGGSGSGLPASSNTGLNFAAATQQDQAKNSTFSFSAGGLNGSGQQQSASGLKLNAGAQSSGGGLSLFNSKPGNGQQQNQSLIFSAGASTQQQPSQPTNNAGGLFNSQQQSTASGLAGFKFSTGANNSQTQQRSSFPSFNASSQASGSSAGFSFSAGTTNAGGGVGGGLFQKSGSTSAQTNNQLAPGNSTQKSGVNFNFSASALGNQQQQTAQQSQQSQSQGGVFAFGQKPNNSSQGFNFSANGSTGLGLGNQSQNGSSGFNFSAGMGMNPGAGTSGGVFSSNNPSQSNIFQNQIRQQQPNSNVFQTPQPQPQKQVSFATPTNQPSQAGFSFPANPSGLNIGFSAGTPRDSGSARPVARARRRKK